MLELGHGHRNAVLILYMWAALLALGTVSFAFVESWRRRRHRGVWPWSAIADRVAAQVDPHRSACDSFHKHLEHRS